MNAAHDPNTDAAAWYARYRDLRMRFALIVGGIALIFAAVMWIVTKTLSIDPGKGTPIGWSVRADGHVATLIQNLEPYIPSLNRDHSKNTYSVGIFLVPVDGSKPRFIPISSEHPANSLGLVRILGGDGRNMWFDVNGVGAVDLNSYALLTGAALGDAPPGNLKGAVPDRLSPRIGSALSTGFFIHEKEWFGLLSPEEAQGEYAPRKWLRRVTHAESMKRMRRFHRGTLGDNYGNSRRIVAMEPFGDAEYLNAAFLRLDDTNEPFRLQDPDGTLMMHTSEPGMKGTVMVSRVSTDGRIIWQVDTEIDRFKLSQIMPGEDATAFVGTRLPVPDKVPEPLLVIVEHATGLVARHSLWR